MFYQHVFTSHIPKLEPDSRFLETKDSNVSSETCHAEQEVIGRSTIAVSERTPHS